jgi:hypothetical protein
MDTQSAPSDSSYNDESDEISLPIEGRSYIPLVMKTLLLGTAAASGILYAFFAQEGFFRDGGSNFHQWLFFAIMGMLALEYLIFLKFVIPMVGNYGRFKIYEHKVEYNPLSATGMSTLRQTVSEPISKFEGVGVRLFSTKSGTYYYVILVHPEKGRSVTVFRFTSQEKSEKAAKALAAKLNVNFIEKIKNRKKRRAL